jgi:hypothetical protein
MSTLNTYNLKSPDSANTNLALDASGNVAIQAGSASAPSIYVTGDTNTGLYSPGADQVAVTTGGTARLFVDASGRLLVGTSSARSNLFNSTFSTLAQLEGAGTGSTLSSFALISNANNNGYQPFVVFAKSRGTVVGSNTIVSNGDTIGTLTFQGSDGSEFVEAALISAEVDGTPGANDMPGRLVFSTTADGASTPTERMRIDSSGLVTLAGPGIKFPATQVASADANTLDDYEEGTFTASIAGTTSAGTASYSARVGNYTKIGRNVYINIFLDYSSGTGTGNTKITGLPFAPAAAYNVISFSTWALYLSYTGAQVVASTSGGSTEISIQQMNTNGVTALPYESGAAFAVSGFYEV